MRRDDIIIRISNETGTSRLLVTEIIQKILEYIIETLFQDKKMVLRDFGVFKVKIRKARPGYNLPHKNKIPAPIPACAVVRFKPGKKMWEMLEKINISDIPERKRKKKENNIIQNT